MALQSFHPVIQKWFSETLGTPTAAQRDGLQEDEDPDEKVDQLRLEATAAHARIS